MQFLRLLLRHSFSALKWRPCETSAVFSGYLSGSHYTWLWWWLLVRLSNHQSMSPKMVFLRTTLTWTIILRWLMIWLLGSNHLQCLLNNIVQSSAQLQSFFNKCILVFWRFGIKRSCKYFLAVHCQYPTCDLTFRCIHNHLNVCGYTEIQIHTSQYATLKPCITSTYSTQNLKPKNVYLPLIVLHTILLGARKWNGPLLGLVLVRFRKKSRYFTRKKPLAWMLSDNNKYATWFDLMEIGFDSWTYIPIFTNATKRTVT